MLRATTAKVLLNLKIIKLFYNYKLDFSSESFFLFFAFHVQRFFNLRTSKIIAIAKRKLQELKRERHLGFLLASAHVENCSENRQVAIKKGKVSQVKRQLTANHRRNLHTFQYWWPIREANEA